MLRARLARRGALVLDGGMGTGLQLAGMSAGEAWTAAYNLDDPRTRAVVSSVHGAYLSAGADVLCANTYNVSGETMTRRLAYNLSAEEALASARAHILGNVKVRLFE